MTSNSKDRHVLVTAALPYSNGTLHLGHIAGAYLPADIYIRFLRLKGVKVTAICGSDDHGVAIMLKAKQENRTPAETAKYYHKKHDESLKSLGINFDIFGSTSQNPYHAKISQDFFLKLYEKGYFEKHETEQFYDEESKMFLPDRFVVGVCGKCGTADQNSDQCENCGQMLDTETLKNPISKFSGKPATIAKTNHWLIDLAKSKKEVEEWNKVAPLRESTKANVKGLLESGLVKRSMTRDISWGIPVPLDDPDAKGKVLYVWFDAPIGYISNTVELLKSRGDSSEPWKDPNTEIIHFIGEDNTIFHCIIWIAMLAAEGSYTLPKSVVVNRFLNIKFPDKDVEKISKSRGNAVWIEEYVAEGGSVDALRYYLASIAPENDRAVYKPEDLIARFNGELGNNIGNLVNRVVTVSQKYFGNKIPDFHKELESEEDKKMFKALDEMYASYDKSMEAYSFRDSLSSLMAFSREVNKYLDSQAPWKKIKTDEKGASNNLYVALRMIKGILYMLSPFVPKASEKGLGILGINAPFNFYDGAKDFENFKGFGTVEVLFPRLEPQA